MQGRLLDEKETAARLNVSVQTLRRWRGPQETGPAVVKLGRAVRYSPAEVEAWIQRCTRANGTSEAA